MEIQSNLVFFVTRGHLPLPYPRYLDEKHTMFNDVQMFDPKKKREKLKATWWLIPPHPCLAASISSSSVNEELNIDSSWEPSRFEPNLFGYSLWHHSKMVCLGLSGWIFVFAIHTVCRSSVLSLQLIHPRHSLMSQPPQNLRATSQMTPFQGNGHGPCGGSHLLPPKIRENQGLLTVAFVDCINRKEKKP